MATMRLGFGGNIFLGIIQISTSLNIFLAMYPMYSNDERNERQYVSLNVKIMSFS